MAKFLPFKLLIPLFLLLWTTTSSSVSGDRKTYIIHMDKSAMPAPFSIHHDWYMSTLSLLSSPDGVAPTHLYTYNHVMDGFSAVLSQAHLDQLRNSPAGNSGPHAYTILNGAPWITTIGAGTIDRDYAALITLGDNELTLSGRSVYPENLFVSEVPIYFGHGNRSKELCDLYSLDPKDVAGKYIFCAFDYDGLVGFALQLDEMYRTGAVGAIFSSDTGQFSKPKDFDMPYVTINPKDGELVKEYMMNAKNATVSIKFQFTLLGTSNFTCEHATLDLNYPSFVVILNNTNTTSFNFKRVLTNVADGSSIYRAMVNAPEGMKVVVQPETISFGGKYSKAEFNMTVSINLGTDASPQSDYIGNFGFLSWYEVNGKHMVRSPIVSAFAPLRV
ncbi:hypothetical protein QYF36_005985 [Acer negundo]|nr:hypothetical protein QYF36_005985 [Acer negundo]